MILENIIPGDIIKTNNGNIFVKEIKPFFIVFLKEKEYSFPSIEEFRLFLFKNLGRVMTKNCQFRAVAGRVGQIASMMALGSTLGTTIDGSHPGSGAISSNGSIDMVQFYFAEGEWIKDWFAARGLDKLGNLMGQETEYTLESLDGEEEINLQTDEIVIEFAGETGVVDKTEDQKFEEIKI